MGWLERAISPLGQRRLAVLLASLCLVLAAEAALEIGTELLARIEKEYGATAVDRIRSWQRIMDWSRDLPEEDKLKVINDFFNQLEFVTDKQTWGVEDYWATPFEFMAKNGGDCEDFSLAKYFTLIELGVAEERLRMTYVTALNDHQSHMVLTYYSSPRAVPLVLDNLDPHILPASQREDLQPVYSFNGTGLWLAKSIGSGKQVGNSERLELWRNLINRMRSSGEDKH